MAISTLVKRKLLASSGGYCGNPACHRDLFAFFETGEISNIEELAHIIGQKEKGPRGDDDLPLSERDEFDNIILLCPTCHTIVDKSPHLYPKETVKKWKTNHEESIKNLFCSPLFLTREEARSYVKPLFAENRSIYEEFGPSSQNAEEKQMATEIEWERQAIKRIIPNNRKIESVVDQNAKLLTEEEYRLFTRFKIHREGFEFNKLSGDVSAVVPTFPVGFENVFK